MRYSAGALETNRSLLDSLLELQSLDRIPRTGYALRGVGRPESIAEHGFHLAVLVWALATRVPEVDLGRILRGRITWIGTVLRARPLEEKIAITQQFAAEMLPLFDRGHCRPVIDCRFPLDDIAAAHEHMQANANVGKILVDL